MFRQVTLAEFKAASSQKKRAVVFQEFPCDDITPVQAFLRLSADVGSVLLESGVKDQEVGRYSLIAIEPFAEFTSKGSSSTLHQGDVKVESALHPLEHLRQTLQDLRVTSSANYPPLVGGAIGFATYDAVRLFEEIPDRHEDTHQLPELFFLFHSVHIAFDHLRGTLLISVNVELTGDVEKDYLKAKDKIDAVRAHLKGPVTRAAAKASVLGAFTEEMGDVEFCEKVKKAKEYLVKGDAFQIVISRTFSCPYPGDPFDIYRALRMVNASSFMFFIKGKDFAIAGASPERLVKLENGKLHTMPIAGTRPRILGEEEKTVQELMQDPKEDAEHMMLVDLGRNDLGRIAKPGSVTVDELKKARHFPHVIHLVSQVKAEIAPQFDALDALRAVFPAGTLSGAPKIRAMEIIDELENSRRGIYGGAVCTIDNNGNLDSCIVIRTAFIKDGVASIRAGAGVVMDSDPQYEADETRAKAKGVMQAIHLAMEGIL